MSIESGSTSRVLTPSIGAPVISSDGEQFAYVREVQGGYFKLDMPLAPDCWLSTAYIESAEADAVRLNISRDDVDVHKLEAPGLDAEQDPDLATKSDAVISDAEALEQRERMERELQEQRARLARERGEAP